MFLLPKKQALGRLHQLEILGQKLVVEFAKCQHKHLAAQERTRYSIGYIKLCKKSWPLISVNTDTLSLNL
jgi:hypothetical protein